MPDLKFQTPDDQPLFPEDDPLTITIPGAKGAEEGTPEAGGTFRCLDRANPPLEDDVDPTTKPMSYMVELLRLQVVEEERDAFEEALVDALRANRIAASTLLEVGRWLGEQREAAERGALSRTVDRPTKARGRSTR